jgi:hypothetical protein
MAKEERVSRLKRPDTAFVALQMVRTHERFYVKGRFLSDRSAALSLSYFLSDLNIFRLQHGRLKNIGLLKRAIDGQA